MRTARPRALAVALAAAPLAGCVVVLPVPVPVPLPLLVAAPAGAAATATPAADPGPPPAAAACTPAAGAAAAEAAVIAEVGALRAARGLAPLVRAPALAAVAQGHACDNAARGATGHVGSDGAGLAARLARGGYRHGVAAENAGRGMAGPREATRLWAASPAHAANLYHPAVREAGLGLAAGGDGRSYWVLVLAEPR